MKLIDKYLLRTFFVPFAYLLVGFSMLYVIVDLFDNLNDFIEGKVPFALVAKYYGILLPSVLVRIVPISLLLAVLYGLSNLTKNNEITAMRASGISIIRLMLPFIGVGFLASIAVGIINEGFGPRAAYWAYNFVREQKTDDPDQVYLKSNLAVKNQVTRRVWLINQFDIRDYRMRGIEVLQQREDTTDESKIRASQGRWLDGHWWFQDVVEQKYDREGNPVGPPRFALLEEMIQFTETPSLFLNEIKDPEFMGAANLADYLVTHSHRDAAALARIRVDLHHRLALPWMCLIVMMLGIPVGAQTGRKGALRGVALSICLFFGFYIAMNLGLALGKKMLVPAWFAGWMPNLLFLGVGGVMVWRMR